VAKEEEHEVGLVLDALLIEEEVLLRRAVAEHARVDNLNRAGELLRQQRFEARCRRVARLNLRPFDVGVPEHQHAKHARRLRIRLPWITKPHRIDVDLDRESWGLYPGARVGRMEMPERQVATNQRAGVVVARQERPERSQSDFEHD
jgi:hypothetical protein